jgi:hypothetical protein
MSSSALSSPPSTLREIVRSCGGDPFDPGADAAAARRNRGFAQMNVKAQGLLNAVRWVEQTYGAAGLRDVLGACEASTRARCTSAIAINWHPVEELLDFVAAAERVLPKSDKWHVAEEIGAAGARANTKGFLIRSIIYISKPEFLYKRVAGAWQQFNDAGEMTLLRIEHRGENDGDNFGSADIAVTGTGLTSALFCRVLSGWCMEIARAIGTQSPVVHHIECTAKRDARCVWRIRGHGKSSSRIVAWGRSSSLPPKP